MKKYVSLLLVFVILLFAACSPAQSPESEPTTSTTAATEPNSTDVLTEPSEPNVTEPSEPSEEATQPSTNPPSEPSDPTVEPTEPPTDPGEPSEPTEPTTKPTEPTEPTTKPTEPTEPTKPTKPTKPTQPSNPTSPSDEVNLFFFGESVSVEINRNEYLLCFYDGDGRLKWKSYDPSIATIVDSRVYGHAVGTTTIEVTDGVRTARCKVTVTDYILTVSPDTLSLTVGQVGELTHSYSGIYKATWKSSNSSVAEVHKGVVTARGAGTAIIELTDGKKSAKCTVTVADMTLSQTLSMTVGQSKNLLWTYAGIGVLTWKSSNPSVADVDADGKVTAKASGTATISLSDGKKQLQCVVTVKDAPVVEGLKIHTPKDTIVFVGETLKLDYTYTGTGKLTFESYDTSRLTIDSNGKMTGISEGGVYVGVTDGNLLKSVRIVVKGVKATSIELFSMEGPLFDGVTKYVGDYMSFGAKSRPNGTARAVRVTTSNSSVVSVNSKSVNSGLDTEITLKYKAAGSATITLTSEDGCVVYKYKVNVKSEYSSYQGKEYLTPEEFSEACTMVMVENGFKKNTGCTSYRVLTLRSDQLTWKIAKGNAQGYVRSWYPNGCRSCWISYEGTDEKGNYIFYTRWG